MSEPPHASSWAAPPEFYIDENLAGKTVRRFIADLGYLVHTPTETFGRSRLELGLRDEDWLPVVGSNGWVVFGRDQRILDRPLELEAYLSARVHMVLLPGEASRDELIGLLRTNLRAVCSAAAARRPNVYWATAQGLVDYERRRLDRERRRRRR